MKTLNRIKILFFCCIALALMVSACSNDKETMSNGDEKKEESVKEPTDYKSEESLNEKLPVMKRTYVFYDPTDYSFMKDQTKKYGLIELTEQDLEDKMKNRESFLLILWSKDDDYRLLFTDQYLQAKKQKAYFFNLSVNYNVTPILEKISSKNNKGKDVENAMKYDPLDPTLTSNSLTMVKNGVIINPIYNDYQDKTRINLGDFEDANSIDREEWTKIVNKWIKEK